LVRFEVGASIYNDAPIMSLLEAPSAAPIELKVKTEDVEPASSQLPFTATNQKPRSLTKTENEESAADATSVSAEPSIIKVYWEEPVDQDPANPMNWPSARKWMNIGVLSSITFLTLVSSCFIF
jgi:hypothetical protein